MGEIMTAKSQLISGMTFAGEAGSGHRLTMDAAEHAGGEDHGFLPMELLIVGLAGCTAMDVIGILRKKRQHVTGYEVQVRGERAEDHPMVFVEVTVEHIVTGHDVQPAAVARAVELSETKYCGASATLSKTAKVTHTFRIEEAAPDAPDL
jgi:putative redox protein